MGARASQAATAVNCGGPTQLEIWPAISEQRSKGVFMSVARVIEISSTSDKSFENAIEQGITRASKNLREIKSAWVKEQEVQVESNKVVAYKVILKVTFVLED